MHQLNGSNTKKRFQSIHGCLFTPLNFSFFSGGLERWKIEKLQDLNYDIRLLPFSSGYNTASEEQTEEVNAGMTAYRSSGTTPILDSFAVRQRAEADQCQVDAFFEIQKVLTR